MAAGLIYPLFADKPARYKTGRDELPRFVRINIGVDFGGNQSAYAFAAAGFTEDWTPIALRTLRIPAKGVSVEQMTSKFVRFAEGIERDFGPVDCVYADSAEQALINSMYQQTKYSVVGSVKGEIIDRIRTMDLLLSTDMTIAEICYETGFNTPSYFTRCFKEYYNKLPSDYVRMRE